VPDWRLLLMGMTETHSAGHNMAHGMDPAHLLGSHPTAPLARRRLVEVYRAVDDTIASVMAACPDGTTTAVVATKGMQPNRDDLASLVLVPELLHRLAFGRPLVDEPAQHRWRTAGRPPVWPDPAHSARYGTDLLRADGPAHRAKRRFHTMAPAPLVTAVKRARRRVAGRTATPVAPSSVDRTPDGDIPVLAGDIDWNAAIWYRHRWPSMRWFALPSFSDAHVRINLRGRERDGIVDPEDYDRACDEVEAELRRVVDPRTGAPVFGDVVRMRSDDPFAPDGPSADIVAVVRAPVDALAHPACGVVGPFAFPRSGSHTENGFLAIGGPGIAPRTLDLHDSVHVGATLLELLGWTVPPTVTGVPMAGILAARAD
jgi:hypothetical protein